MMSTWHVPKPRDKIVLLLKAAAGCKKSRSKLVVRVMPGDSLPRLGKSKWYSKTGKWEGKRKAIEVGSQFLAHYGLVHHFINWNP